MKYSLAISAAIVLAACTDAPADQNPSNIETAAENGGFEPELAANIEDEVPSYNEEVWYISNGWPGEYPPGFSILADNVTLPARAGMHDSLPLELSCPLPQNATYQQWNGNRVEADNLTFVTVSEKFDITITDEAEIDAPAGEFDNPNNTLQLQPGDKITYLRYLGEGWTLVEVNGQERDVNEMDLLEISDIREVGEKASEDMLWLNLPCGNDRGWVLLSDALSMEGVFASPIIGYGESRDLTEDDRILAVEQARWASQFEKEQNDQ